MTVIVDCPQCRERYRLPERLMGSRGARISCPACGAHFDVAREPRHRVLEMPPAPEARPAAPPPLVPEARPAAPPPLVPEARPAAPPPPAPEAGPALPPRPVPEAGRAVALEVVEGLAPHVARLRHAQARGRLLAEAGVVLLQAFDEYRRRAGAAARAAVFREALRSRWNIDVPGQDHPPGA